ncbi:MAG: hypothetical protein M1833_001998 [Piccolia ochrophora]|nr:MAG: hypothetical protein M1833_001998 [Piccolia ochrophora]
MTASTMRSAAKSLIICCDGTWQNSDNGYVKETLFDTGHLQIPSNVTRIARAIKAERDADQHQQIVYYQAGVGTGNSVWDKVVGGGTGMGLSENCREAYAFLANNWCPDDTIILIGFSRGAYTARSIAGLIGAVGLLTKQGLSSFYQVFKDYEHSKDPSYKSKFPHDPFKNKPSFSDPNYGKELESRQLTRLNIPIKAVAVWDTVGSLGIPSIAWLEKIGITPENKEYSFYDTNLNDNIENAFHALALDEQRGPFSPAVWEKRSASRTNLKQVWFPGVHTNVGGGYSDRGTSDITMAWMLSQLKPFIEFDPYYLKDQFHQSQQYYEAEGQSTRSWGLGRIYNSLQGFHILAGKKPRTPGRYFRADPATSKQTTQPMENTNEYIHASVRVRLGASNMGTDDYGTYSPVALKDWKLISDGKDNDPEAVRWEYVGPSATRASGPQVLHEDVLGDLEVALLQNYPDIYPKVLGVSPPE